MGTGHGLYVGGLDGWGNNDYTHGFIQSYYTSQGSNLVCIRVENVL